jgi:hypothetical protein
MIRSPQRQLAPDTVGPGIDETTSLRGIADKAEHDKEHRFGNLYGELNEALLKEAWRGLNQSAASGIDQVMARDYEQVRQGDRVAEFLPVGWLLGPPGRRVLEILLPTVWGSVEQAVSVGEPFAASGVGRIGVEDFVVDPEEDAQAVRLT